MQNRDSQSLNSRKKAALTAFVSVKPLGEHQIQK